MFELNQNCNYLFLNRRKTPKIAETSPKRLNTRYMMPGGSTTRQFREFFVVLHIIIEIFVVIVGFFHPKVALFGSISLPVLTRNQNSQIPLSHTTYQYHSQKNQKVPNTSIIPVKLKHCGCPGSVRDDYTRRDTLCV